jgi:GNAT superfamily N-acetyltransferase
MINIRDATDADAEAMSEVVTASIRDLCSIDHGDDPRRIAQWNSNKTPAHFRRWLATPGMRLFLAERDGMPAGAGSLSLDDGVIQLAYVAPQHRSHGVTSALLAHMEAVLRQAGIDTARLISTETAHRFYVKAGWVADGPPVPRMDAYSHPMRKQLASGSA